MTQGQWKSANTRTKWTPATYEPWHEHANCARMQVDVADEIFFPVQEQGPLGESLARPAKRICADCPVTWECLETALATRENFGIWGGLTARERDTEIRRRNRERRRNAA